MAFILDSFILDYESYLVACILNINPNSFVICTKVYPSVKPSASTVKPIRPNRDMGPLLPFEELVNEDVYVDEPFKQEDDDSDANKDCNLPNPCALLHVTNRKKAPSQKKSLSMVCDVMSH